MICRLLLAVVLLAGLNGPAVAQLPRVGIIDFYGLRTLTPADLVQAVGVQIGDSLVAGATELRARLEQVPGVAAADVSLVCCEAGRSLLYVGIREHSTETPAFKAAPAGFERLPAGLVAAGSRFNRALLDAVRANQAAEDDSQGHSLIAYPPARAEQDSFRHYAATHLDTIRAVLHNSSDAQQRALAAQVIAYAPDKKAIVADLVAAVRDPDAGVRNNALRALAVLAMYAQSQPDSGIVVPYAPFIDLLNSLHWSDRNKASFALAALTTAREPALLAALRAPHALAALVEMARWRASGHAFAPAVILGRLAGMSEQDIFETFNRDKNALIGAALR